MLKPLRRKTVNKHRSANQFKRNTTRTKRQNITAPARGGIRL